MEQNGTDKNARIILWDTVQLVFKAQGAVRRAFAFTLAATRYGAEELADTVGRQTWDEFMTCTFVRTLYLVLYYVIE